MTISAEPSPELRAIIDSIPKDFADPEASFEDVRRAFEPIHGHPTGEDFEIDRVAYGGVSCGSYRLPHNANLPIALHCHGGAFVSTPVAEYHFYAELIARQTGCAVVMPDYRLAPEHPYPAAHDDCFNAYRGLLEASVAARDIVLLGESCGGSLAIGLLLRARDEGLDLPRCFVSLSGWFDLSVAGAPAPGRDPFIEPQWVRNRGQDYLQGELQLDDPRVSPAYADLAGLPPLYLQVGEYDTVREGALRLATNAARCGVEVLLASQPKMIQGLHGLVNAGVPEAQAAWDGVRDYIDARFERTA